MQPQISGVEAPRDARGHFLKGQSGNPGGRTKDHRDIQELARSLAPAALRTLGHIMEDKDAPHAARVAAAGIVLDRGYGKPIQPTVIAAVPFSDLDDGALLQTIMRKAAELGAPSPPLLEHQEADEPETEAI
jgi:hypothetical protein